MLRDININIVRTGLIHGMVVIIFDDYDELNAVNVFNSRTWKKFQKTAADLSLDPSKGRPFQVTYTAGKTSFWFAPVLLLFHLDIKVNEKMSVEFPFGINFEATPPRCNINRALNCLCLRLATEEPFDHTATPPHKQMKLLTQENGTVKCFLSPHDRYITL